MRIEKYWRSNCSEWDEQVTIYKCTKCGENLTDLEARPEYSDKMCFKCCNETNVIQT